MTTLYDDSVAGSGDWFPLHNAYPWPYSFFVQKDASDSVYLEAQVNGTTHVIYSLTSSDTDGMAVIDGPLPEVRARKVGTNGAAVVNVFTVIDD